MTFGITGAELAFEIANVRSIVSAAQCGYLDRDTLKAMMEHALALQAE